MLDGGGAGAYGDALGRRACEIRSQPGAILRCSSLEGRNVRFQRESKPEFVETLQQALLPERINLKSQDSPAGRYDLAAFQFDLQVRAGVQFQRLLQVLHDILGQDDRQ
jgi:hypothetical protein